MRAWLLLLAACGGSTPEIVAPPKTDSAETVEAWVLRNSKGAPLGRIHGRTLRNQKEGRWQTVTRLLLDGPPKQTVEYASVIREDLSPVSHKQLSSAEGRLELRFGGGFVSVLTDVANRQVPYERDTAAPLAEYDLPLLARVLAGSGLTPGQAGKLRVRRPDDAGLEEWPVQVFADADRRTVFKLPQGQVTLKDARIVRYENKSGWIAEPQTPGEPPQLLPLPAPTSYERPVSASWQDRELLIEVADGHLGATLSVPRNRARWPGGLAPGVLFFDDLGAANRHGFTATYDRGTWQLLDHLADAGFAVLRVDDRGTGGSKTATVSEAGFEIRSADARAMLEALRRQPDVDPERVLVVAHGYGALVALALAGQESLRGVALLAAPFRPFERQQGARWAALTGVDPLEGERLVRVAILAAGGHAAAEGQAPAELVRSFRALGAELTAAQTPIQSLLSPVTEPVAIFQGMKDFEISWREDAQALTDALNRKNKKQAQLFAYEYVDHLFKTQPGTSTLATYLDTGRKLDPQFLGDLVRWLAAR